MPKLVDYAQLPAEERSPDAVVRDSMRREALPTTGPVGALLDGAADLTAQVMSESIGNTPASPNQALQEEAGPVAESPLREIWGTVPETRSEGM